MSRPTDKDLHDLIGDLLDNTNYRSDDLLAEDIRKAVLRNFDYVCSVSIKPATDHKVVTLKSVGEEVIRIRLR